MNEISWKTIKTLFKDNPEILVKHHLQSYNDFFEKGVINIFKNSNPLRFYTNLNKDIQKYRYECNMYFGGKNGDKIYYGKPMIYDKTNNDSRQHYMYPNEARLRNMTYAFTIHYDLEVEYTLLIDNNSGKSGMDGYDEKKISKTYEKIYLGKFPIMVKSDLCILKGLTKEAIFNLGECRNDFGGYFIIDGKEKVIISQEGRADNILYIKEDVDDKYSHAAEIRSVSEDSSKPIRTLSVRMVKEQPTRRNNNIVVNVPNVRKPVPLFILMRALGIISDKEIIETCLLDLEKYDMYVDLFRPSVYDAGNIFTQMSALKYMATFTKGKTVQHILDILMNYFLPHIGEGNFRSKALYLGYMVKKMLMVYKKHEKPTNRDSYSSKRIEISGMLIQQLFREYFSIEQKNIYLKMDKEYYYKGNDKNYQDMDFLSLLDNNLNKFFSERHVEKGFKKGFKGNWGAEAHTKRIGLVQDLNRLSFFWYMTLLRKTNLPIAADGAKIVAPRLLNGTQYGYLCPIHSPDGGNIGLHKHLSTSTHITSGCSIKPFLNYLRLMGIKILEECSLNYLSKATKIIINGNWIGVTIDPIKIVNLMKYHRRNNIIDIYTSISFNPLKKEILIWTDAGRVTRPLFYMLNKDDDVLSFERDNVLVKFDQNKLNWNEFVYGFLNTQKKTNGCNIENINNKIPNLMKNASIVEYIDAQEGESMVLAHSQLTRDAFKENNVTHCEIHPSLILGVMANQIIFPSHNPYPRNAFSCGQSKQAVSLYNTNFNNRIDKTALVLNYGQIPLTKSRLLDYATNEQHPYGENTIVAIMCYSGYNVEDAIIVNEGALKRGLFRTTYYNSYESHEEKIDVGDAQEDSFFLNPLNENMIGLKSGYDYSLLDQEHGIIKENSVVTDKTILIGKGTKQLGSEKTVFLDSSVKPKKGQVGYVDKSFITQNEEGKRLAKVRIRAERIPAIGDKFCSRAGQKGTIGIILREQDMPTTKDGLIPDIIVNPHAMPSRMTIGHLVETLTSKAACVMGSFSNCTAFESKGPKHELLGKILSEAGYHKSGCDYLYNGMTGEQLESAIYIGPTYYLRLKHMPKDKINYRARGPRTVLTRQTVQGRANDGGLRIGEMDRDCLIAHGMNQFIKESMLVRGDEYFMAVCNNSGCVAIYNESKNLFLSPMCDGPIKFVGNLDNTLNIVNVSKYGRDFSVIRVPYAFKLLMQELQTMNIQMRIITDKNVNHLESMKKSDNVFNLTKQSLDSVLNNTNNIIKQNVIRPYPLKEIKQKISDIQQPTGLDDGVWDDSDSTSFPIYLPGSLDEEESIKPLIEGNIPLKQGELPASALSKEQLETEIKNGRVVLNLWEPIFLNHFVRWIKNTKEDIILEKFPLINAYDNLSEEEKKYTYWNNKNTFLDDIKNKWRKSLIKVSKEEFKEYIEKVYRISQQYDRTEIIWDEGVEKKDPPPRDEKGNPVGWRYKSPKDHYGEFPESPWDKKDLKKEDVEKTLKDDSNTPSQEKLDKLPEGIDLEKEGLDPEKDIVEEDMESSVDSDYSGEIDEETGLEKIQIGGKVFLEVEEPPEIKITRKTLNDDVDEKELQLLNTDINEEIKEEEKKDDDIKKVIK